MKKLGWSQDLVDAVKGLSDIIATGSLKEVPLKGLDDYKIEQFSSTTINTSHYPSVGQTFISLNSLED